MAMLANPLCRLGVSLASLRTQLPCGSRCAPASNPFLPPRQLRSTNPKFIPPAALVLRQQRCLGHTTNPTTSPPLRFASSSATSPEPPTTTATPPPQAPTLSWNDYLALRKSRRRYNLVASIITSLGTTSVGVTVLGQQNFDQLGGLFGLDPIIVLIAATASSGAVGWLLGPFVGNAVFGMVHRGIGGQIAEKEKDFYRRIKRYRVDPSSQSFSNPVPDYYGEKIGSVSEFRNWMKDQRAYNKKRQSFL